MAQVLQSDIFFFITSIFVVVLTVVLIISGFYLIKIMKDFADVAKRIKKTVRDTTSSIEEVGSKISDSALFNLIFSKNKKKGRQ